MTLRGRAKTLLKMLVSYRLAFRLDCRIVLASNGLGFDYSLLVTDKSYLVPGFGY
jgi:hypothetical protein